MEQAAQHIALMCSKKFGHSLLAVVRASVLVFAPMLRAVVDHGVSQLEDWWCHRRVQHTLQVTHQVLSLAVVVRKVAKCLGNVSVRDCWSMLASLRKEQSDPATPAGSRHSCQPTVKLHTLPLVWNFPLGKG